jgi:hypothetical protein
MSRAGPTAGGEECGSWLTGKRARRLSTFRRTSGQTRPAGDRNAAAEQGLERAAALLSGKTKKKAKQGAPTLYVLIRGKLKDYKAAKENTLLQLDLLQDLEQLVGEWFARHPNPADKMEQTREEDLKKLQAEAKAEIDKLSDTQQQYRTRMSATQEARKPRSKQDPNVDQSSRFAYLSSTGAEGARPSAAEFQTARGASQSLGLSDEELAAIRVYSGGDYFLINPVLAGSDTRLEWGMGQLS